MRRDTFRCPKCDEVKPTLGAIYVKWDGANDVLTCELCAPRLASERRAVIANMGKDDLIEEATSLLHKIVTEAANGRVPSIDDCRMVVLDVLEAAEKDRT